MRTKTAAEGFFRYVAPDEYAEARGVTRQTVYRHLHAGSLPGAHQVNGLWQIPLEVSREVAFAE